MFRIRCHKRLHTRINITACIQYYETHTMFFSRQRKPLLTVSRVRLNHSHFFHLSNVRRKRKLSRLHVFAFAPGFDIRGHSPEKLSEEAQNPTVPVQLAPMQVTLTPGVSLGFLHKRALLEPPAKLISGRIIILLARPISYVEASGKFTHSLLREKSFGTSR